MQQYYLKLEPKQLEQIVDSLFMVSIQPDELHFDNLVQVAECLFLRVLPSHVCVGPMPQHSLADHRLAFEGLG